MPDRVLMIGADELEAFVTALAPPARRRILEVLHGRELNVGEIAKALGLTQSTTVAHVQALERAGLITTELRPARRGVQKICSAPAHSAVVLFRSSPPAPAPLTIVTEMPIGLFFDYEVHPTCGLASEVEVIGFQDHPDSFTDPRRSAAGIIWFGHGFVEYRLPVALHDPGLLEEVSVSAEVCSEYPGWRAEWPSDITLSLNSVEVGTFTSPGDPGDRPGQLNPSWWVGSRTQYGFLKEWRVTGAGSFVDGVRVSEVTLDRIRLEPGGCATVRIGVKNGAANRGGINLFGSSFGNHPQDIRFALRLR